VCKESPVGFDAEKIISPSLGPTSSTRINLKERNMTQTPELHLISFDICPFVERSRIVLEEKGLDYELTFIDLSDKPDWFLEISPRGKVPVLQVDGRPIFESMVINEYLEEAFPEPALFPSDPVSKAQARAWIVYANDVVMPPFAKLTYSAKTAEEVRKAREDLRATFEKLDSELAERGTDYFMSDEFGLVDAIYAPIWSRMEVIRQKGHEELTNGLPNWRAYGQRLLERPSCIAARAENLVEKSLESAA
jgi:glutathione S-transferase